MVTLNKKETKRFLKMVEEGLKHPVGPVPTPKIDEAIKLIMQDAEKNRSSKNDRRTKRV